MHRPLFVAGQNSQESTPKATKSRSNSPKSGSSATTPVASSGKPCSPPPVTYSQQSSDSSSHGDSTNGSQQNGGDVPIRRLSSTSDEIILNFPSTVDGYSRVASSGSDVRDRCRDLLAKALQKGLEGGKSDFSSPPPSIRLSSICQPPSRPVAASRAGIAMAAPYL